MASISLTSLATGSTQNGIDVQAVVDQIMYAERAPERLWQQQQARLDSQSGVLNDIQNKLDSLESAFNSLTDITGTLAARTATSSNPNLLTATAATNTNSASHTVVVRQLASVSSWYSKALPDGTSGFTAGTGFTIKVGEGNETAITFDEQHNTLNTAADYLNSLALGVTANVVTDVNGARLTLVSNQTGSAGSIQISSDSTGLLTDPPVAGTNALLTVDGVSVESTSNTISGVISGVTLQLNGVDPNAPVQLTVAPDKDAITQSINSFVNAYNSVVNAVNAQFTYDPSAKSAGVLAGDSALRDLQSRLLSDISYALKGSQASVTSLRSMGVTMNNDGTLTVNSGKLSDTIRSHYADLQSFLQKSGSGFAASMQEDLDKLTDFVNGPIRLELRGIQNSKTSFQQQIDNFEARMLDRQQTLLAQYSNVDSMLRQLPVLQQQLTAQLNMLSNK
jgi:flagellar hook-associated protein 2